MKTIEMDADLERRRYMVLDEIVVRSARAFPRVSDSIARDLSFTFLQLGRQVNQLADAGEVH